MAVGSVLGTSAYDQMQAWSAKRSAAYDTFQSNTATLTAALGGTAGTSDTLSAMLTGGSGSSSSTFISNDALSSSLFGNVANNLSAEETLMSQVIYTRVMTEQYAKQQAQQDQIDGLMSSLQAVA